MKGREIQLSDGRRVRFETMLGFKLGTRVFLEEIVGTFYYNFIQGMVYGGAMLVLVAVGFYLAGAPLWVAVAGFGIEALLLLMFAVVTAYSPPESAGGASAGKSSLDVTLTQLSNSVRDMTNSVSDLFRLASQTDLRQDVLLTRLSEFLSKTTAESARMQVEKLNEIHETLKSFADELALNQYRIREEYVKVTEKTEQTRQKLQGLAEELETGETHGDDPDGSADQQEQSKPVDPLLGSSYGNNDDF